MTKEPYVKEEVSVKKKPVTETRQVTDEVRSERVNVEPRNWSLAIGEVIKFFKH